MAVRLRNPGAIQTGWVETFDDASLTALVSRSASRTIATWQPPQRMSIAPGHWRVRRALRLAPDVGSTVRVRCADRRLSTAAGRRQQISVSAYKSRGKPMSGDGCGRGNAAPSQSAQAVEADFRSAQESLAAATAKAYFSAIEANIQTGIARETVGILEETLRIVTVKHENGMCRRSQDVSLARSDLATARERLTALEGSFPQCGPGAGGITGPLSGRRARSSRDAARRATAAACRHCPSELLERRPDIVAAERRVAAAFNATNQARAARLPTIGLTGRCGWRLELACRIC